MERIKRTYAIQLDFAQTKHKQTNMKYKQYDYGANEIDIQIVYDGVVVPLDDEIIVGVFKGVDNKVHIDVHDKPLKSYGTIVDKDLGIITIPILKELSQISGKLTCEIVVISQDGRNRLTSQSFDFEIVSSLLDLENIESEVEV